MFILLIIITQVLSEGKKHLSMIQKQDAKLFQVDDEFLRNLDNKHIFDKIFQKPFIQDSDQLYQYLITKKQDFSDFSNFWQYLIEMSKHDSKLPQSIENESKYKKWKRIIALLNSLQYSEMDNSKRATSQFLPNTPKIQDPPLFD